MIADVLSDVLAAVRLTGAVYFHMEMSSPWVAETPASREIAPNVMPGAQRVIEYHLVAVGACRGHAVGQPPIRLEEGDIIALWRMQLASRLLIGGGPVAEVAGAVGYESEAAFSRAFKKLVGQAPATWRKGQ